MKICVLPGDGIGVEITAQAVRVLQALDLKCELETALLGGCAVDATGSPFPEATQKLAKEADAVLLGAVGGPKWDVLPREQRPERGLLGIRKHLGLFANLRPAVLYPELANASTLKPEIVAGLDIMIVRELTGGVYFGQRTRTETAATDLCEYSVAEVERVVRRACTLARGRRNYVVSVDKANVLETSRLWRQVASRVAREEFPDVRIEHQLVDSMAMHLISHPREYDVIVTENMFGDILTDEASMLAGSMGLLPSASLGEGRLGLYEPIHGSAPDISGRGIANPCGAILSAAMLLRHSLGLEAEARCIEAAVAEAIDHGALTADLAPSGTAIGTEAMTRAVLARLQIDCIAVELRD